MYNRSIINICGSIIGRSLFCKITPTSEIKIEIHMHILAYIVNCGLFINFRLHYSEQDCMDYVNNDQHLLHYSIPSFFRNMMRNYVNKWIINGYRLCMPTVRYKPWYAVFSSFSSLSHMLTVMFIRVDYSLYYLCCIITALVVHIHCIWPAWYL